MIDLTLNRPECFTKELKLQSLPGNERRLRISSNLLDVMGFAPGCSYERRTLGAGAGFEFRTSLNGSKQVYRRTYTQRRNNPCESIIDDKNQEFLNAALPYMIERVHLTIRDGVIVGRPVAERTFHIRKAFRDPTQALGMFAALSSGVDASFFSAAGFEPHGLLDFRPIEKRDIKDGRVRDVTESGILTAIANNPFKFVFNEDIFRIDFKRMGETLNGQPRPAVLLMAPQCDEYSSLKGKAAREASIASLDTTFDMAWECLRLVEVLEPATILIENVSGFGTSTMGQMMVTKLRRWGYNVTAGVHDARDFGGATSRRRWLAVASVYPGFEAPVGNVIPTVGRVWAMIADQLPFCRDVSDSSALKGGLETGRARLITIDSASAPTITKSEAHCAKDAIRILTPDGRYLAPNEIILRRLQGIQDSFNLNAVSQEVSFEQVGQSVDGHTFEAFAKAIRRHLAVNRGEEVAPIVNVVPMPNQPNLGTSGENDGETQMPLFG